MNFGPFNSLTFNSGGAGSSRSVRGITSAVVFALASRPDPSAGTAVPLAGRPDFSASTVRTFGTNPDPSAATASPL